MVKIWFNRVVLGEVKFSEVSPKYKEKVRAMLIEKGREDLIDE